MPILKILTDSKVPIKIWSDDIEAEAELQLKKVASLPFIFKHVSVMPDVHAGKGSTIGTVIATKGAISPAAVGVDIGCGMMAVKTNLPANIVADRIVKIRNSIERSVPVGFNSHKAAKTLGDHWIGWGDFQNLNVSNKILNDKQKFLNQLGTLGGGNHFIEICLDTENSVWVMLHSGSRNIGKTIADIHIDKAKSHFKQMMWELEDPDLAYVVEGSPDFQEYMFDLEWAQKYAFENRKIMMAQILKDLAFAIPEMNLQQNLEVNCHHNYACREHHYGENVLVTRKGAVRARKDDLGIIPGSMGARSFIVRGLGSQESFHSCSHGAGRKMSRTKARATFTAEDLSRQTEGVECRKDFGVVDEIPGAYKDIEKVMANQSDLVEIVAELKQIMCIKG